ncbi:hypothetical protein BSKO_13544 [Bryopsis sp. KO-2023]|nr:hypothetical protein BSKO_13544 [Bryopsis sp. KO-2023]
MPRRQRSSSFLALCLLASCFVSSVISQDTGQGCTEVLPTLSTLESVTLDSTALESLNGDLQSLINCMPENSELFLDLLEIELQDTLVVEKSLSIESVFKGTSSSARTSIRCPPGGKGALDIRPDEFSLSRITIIDCGMNSTSAPILIQNSKNATLHRLECSGNSNKAGPGCLSIANSSVDIFHSDFTSNEGVLGGAVSITARSFVNIKNSGFTENNALIGGGAVYVQASVVDISVGSYEKNNAVDDGGAIFVQGGEFSDIVISDVDFIGNTIHGEYLNDHNFRAGGALALFGEQISCTVFAGTFTNNTAAMDGGAIAVMNGTNLSVVQSKFYGNRAFQGGALYVQSDAPITSDVSFRDCTFMENLAGGAFDGFPPMGGAVGLFNDGVSCEFDNCKFTRNYGGDYGGAIVSARVKNLNITRSQFFENHAARHGGALSLQSEKYHDAGALLSESLFDANWVEDGDIPSRGGAVYAWGQGLTCVINGGTVFEGNHAVTCGGALSVGRGASVLIDGGRFSINEAINGSGGGVCIEDAGFNNGGTELSLDDVKFTENRANQGGGLMASGMGAKVDMRGMNFTGNVAANMGGAVGADAGRVTASNSTFLINRASSGGAVAFLEPPIANVTFLDIETTDFTWNEATEGSGGAVHLSGESVDATFRDVAFENNTASQDGGAINVDAGPRVAATDTSFENNRAIAGGGGAIAAESALSGSMLLSLTEAFFRNNSADGPIGVGGALFLQKPGLICNIDRGTFIANGAKDVGGAISVVLGAALESQNTEFTANYAGEGGAIWAQSDGIDTRVKMSDCSFERNVALEFHGDGGALSLQGWAVMCELSGVLFRLNSASDIGGAISVMNATSLVVGNDTKFENNTASAGGAIYAQSAGTVATTIDIKESIFDSNEGRSSGFGATTYGGAIQLFGKSIECSLANSVSFLRNTATRGGAISVMTGSKLQAKDISFVRNSADSGGAISSVAGTTVELKDVRFEENLATNGTGGGIEVMAASEPTSLVLESVEFVNNQALGDASDGGAILAVGKSISMSVKGGMFWGNTAEDVGGAMYVSSVKRCLISNAKFEQNRAPGGGALFAQSVGDPLQIQIVDNIFRNNSAHQAFGGAIDFGSASNATLEGKNFFQGNVAATGGGAIFAMNSTGVMISGATFTSNFALEGQGGAIWAWSPKRPSVLALSRSIFYNNSVKADNGRGGAVSVEGAKMSVSLTEEVEFHGNEAFIGGAMEIRYGASLAARNSTFDANLAGEGGAIFAEGTHGNTTIGIFGTTFRNNTALIGEDQKGGAIAIVGSRSFPDSSVICVIGKSSAFLGNAASRGGAISVEDSELLLNGVWFTTNKADRGGAVWAQAFQGGKLEIGEVIFDGNIASAGDGVCGALDFIGARLETGISSKAQFVNVSSTQIASELFLLGENEVLKNVSCSGQEGNK